MLALERPKPTLNGAGLCAGSVDESRGERVAGDDEWRWLLAQFVDSLLHLRGQFAHMKGAWVVVTVGSGYMAHHHHQLFLYIEDHVWGFAKTCPDET